MLNIVSLIIKSFHLFIILRLEDLIGAKYRCVLINTALTGIITTTTSAIFYTCHDFFMFNFAFGELRIPIVVMTRPSNYISFHAFVVASMEKYLAICKPFSYQSSVFLWWLPLNFVILWLHIFSRGTTVTVTNVLNLIPGMSYLGTTVFWTAVFTVAPNLLCYILLIKAYKDLKRMRSQPGITSRQTPPCIWS